VFGVSRSGYYAWKGRPEAPRAQEDAELVIEIKVASEVGRGSSPRVHREPRAQGRRISGKRVERLMRQEGIVARKKRRFRKTTDSSHSHPIAPNVLARNFNVELPDTAWVTDVTYVWTHQGWLYLAAISTCSRDVWSVGQRMLTTTVRSQSALSIGRHRQGYQQRDWSTIRIEAACTPAATTATL
jgi:putative transposase